MSNQARKTIMAALVAQIKAQAPGFKSVYDDVKHTSELSAGDYPTCLIVEAGDSLIDEITSTQDFLMTVIVRIIADTDLSIDEFRDLDESLVDAINSDITLNGTCIYCLPKNSDPPMMWQDTSKFCTRRLLIRYRRNF